MRKLLGIVVLVVGVGGLGLWARSNEARQMETRITAEAATVARGAVHGAVISVSGRDITASGLADTEAERRAILAALDAVPGRRVVRDDLRVLPVAAPFRLGLVKADPDAAIDVVDGNVPTETYRAIMAGMIPGDVTGLQLASGAPASWSAQVGAAVSALQILHSGEARLDGETLTITGRAFGPVEAALVETAVAGLPSAKLDLTLLDDGTPPVWTLDYDAGRGLQLDGKLPRGVAPGDVAAALGLSDVTGSVVQGLLGPQGSVAVPAALARWLPGLELLRGTFGPAGAELEVGVGRGVDRDALAAAMAPDLAALGQPVAMGVVEVQSAAGEGATRTHVLTGVVEEYRRGWWLPKLQIAASVDTCKRLADDVLQGATINFLSGSDELDGSAREVISRLAAVLGPCTREGGLKALIGGHTDATGNAEMNLGLSQRRATTVRLALVDRGVPAAALRAQGYGPAVPVATNDTEEGRAANRRTTIDWSE